MSLMNEWFAFITFLAAIGRVDSSLLHGSTIWDIKVSCVYVLHYMYIGDDVCAVCVQVFVCMYVCACCVSTEVFTMYVRNLSYLHK